jgi:hypothetical protein
VSVQRRPCPKHFIAGTFSVILGIVRKTSQGKKFPAKQPLSETIVSEKSIEFKLAITMKKEAPPASPQAQAENAGPLLDAAGFVAEQLDGEVIALPPLVMQLLKAAPFIYALVQMAGC